MKTIFSKVKLRPGQIVQLFLLVLLSAVGQMLLPSFLLDFINRCQKKLEINWLLRLLRQRHEL